MKVLVINNLSSGYGEGAIYDFLRSFAQPHDEICIRTTDFKTGFDHLLKDAQEFDLVIASGGDGTVARVSYELRNTQIPILPFPAGTANLLALNLASPIETHALAQLAREGKTLDFDLGEICVQDKRFGFSIIAGAGFDADIMNSAKPFKHLWGPLAYFGAALRNPVPQKTHFTIEIDGKTLERDGVGILLVNFSKIQFDLTVTHLNTPRDGQLDLVILKANHALELVPSIIAAALDADNTYPDRGEALEIMSGREFKIHADPAIEVQYDGETTGLFTPFSARVLPNANRLVVSDKGYELFKSDSLD